MAEHDGMRSKSQLRALASFVARTPLHPQWLLGPRIVPNGIEKISGRFLDIGAADRWLEPLLPPCTEYLALDYPATGRDLYGSRPDVFADAARLPFDDGCFDGVACLEVLEHVPDPVAVMREISRVLRRGGQAWISMPFLYPTHDAPFDFQRHTRHGLQRDAQLAGLDVVDLRPTGHAVRTAGLLACLAIAGGVNDARGALRWLLLPLALVFVPAINLLAWAGSFLLPDWEAMAHGHALKVRKP